MIIFLAGLRQIPRELYEAAEVDGAGPVRRFLRITMPLLTPIIFFNLVLQTINSFQAFTQSFIVDDHRGDHRHQLPRCTVLGVLWRQVAPR
jgi:multiple sugar transport system permease protein